MMAMAKVDGRVCAFLEPIALYMCKDLHAPEDGGWQFGYPPPEEAMVPGEGRVYHPEAEDLLIVTFGNGVPMALRVARRLAEDGFSVRVLDLRWLVPLNEALIAEQAAACRAVLVLDEGRRSGGLGEAIITALVERGQGGKPIARVCGADTYTPLASAAFLVLPDENAVEASARDLLRPRG